MRRDPDLQGIQFGGFLNELNDIRASSVNFSKHIQGTQDTKYKIK
jgi:hypothetical protein